MKYKTINDFPKFSIDSKSLSYIKKGIASAKKIITKDKIRSFLKTRLLTKKAIKYCEKYHFGVYTGGNIYKGIKYFFEINFDEIKLDIETYQDFLNIWKILEKNADNVIEKMLNFANIKMPYSVTNTKNITFNQKTNKKEKKNVSVKPVDVNLISSSEDLIHTVVNRNAISDFHFFYFFNDSFLQENRIIDIKIFNSAQTFGEKIDNIEFNENDIIFIIKLNKNAAKFSKIRNNNNLKDQFEVIVDFITKMIAFTYDLQSLSSSRNLIDELEFILNQNIQ